jgi:hypothetical protein
LKNSPQNLAAFLTVERLVSTVKNLEQLSQQTKINYTVVQNSSNYEYFKVESACCKYIKLKDQGKRA